MASLLDIGPLTEIVTVCGVNLIVKALTAADIFKLFAELPDMKGELEKHKTTNAVFLNVMPSLAPKIIAICTGSPGDVEAERKAAELGAEDQMKILLAVQRLSFPQGIGPFVENLGNLIGSATSSTSLGTQAIFSRGTSAAELQTDSVGMLRGASPRDNSARGSN
jgi:hypothetical protein